VRFEGRGRVRGVRNNEEEDATELNQESWKMRTDDRDRERKMFPVSGSRSIYIQSY